MTQNNKPGNFGALTKFGTSTGQGALQKHQGISSLSSRFGANPPLVAETKKVLEAARADLVQSTMKTALDTRAEATIQEAANKINLRIAICLDFTASTCNLVQQFKQHSAEIVRGLTNQTRSVDVLPIAFLGDKNRTEGVSYLAASGAIGNTSWWDGVENVTNNRNEPPIVAGLQEIGKRNFFIADKSILNVGIIVADEGIVKDAGYDATIAYLLKTNALVISIIENSSDTVLQSYEQLLGAPLGDRSTVITSFGSPVMLAKDFTEFSLRERARVLDSGNGSKVPGNDTETSKLSSLLGFLERKGHSNLAISQGNGTRLLTKK